MWWILGFRADAAGGTPGSSRGVVAEVVEGRGLLERGEMGFDAVAPPPAVELLVPTSSASAVGRAAKASGTGDSTDWIRRLNMF